MLKINGKIILSVLGALVGLLNGVGRDNYLGISDMNDLVELLGFCIPFAVIGLVIGWGIDYLKSKQK